MGKPPKVSRIEYVFLSECLGRQTHINILLPYGSFSAFSRGPTAPYKTLLLLHGKSDDYTTWLRCSIIENLAREYGVAVVMPDAGNSFYRDMACGPAVYSYINNELPRVLRGMLPLSGKKEDNFIAGFSMGGYGALSIGSENYDKYSAIGCFSSAADVARLSLEATALSEEELRSSFEGGVLSQKLYDRNMFLGIFGDTARSLYGGIHDLFTVLPCAASEDRLLPVFQTCGTSDFLYSDNIRLRDILKEICTGFTYREYGGGHEWSVWNRSIADYFAFLRENGLL